MYKQITSYGCGLYAVAHALNLYKGFVTPERVEASRPYGNSIGQLSKWLQESGIDWYMQPWFYDNFNGELSDTHCEMKVNGDVLAMPLVFCVKLSESGLNHMIGAHLDKEGSLFVYDSLRDDMFATTLSGLKNHYHLVFGMYSFADCETGKDAFIA